MATTFCPDCGQKIDIGPKPKRGQWVSCPHCNADLEIVNIRPLELDWATYDEDEDFDDDLFLDDDDDLEDWDDDDDWDDEDYDEEDYDEEDEELDWEESETS